MYRSINRAQLTNIQPKKRKEKESIQAVKEKMFWMKKEEKADEFGKV